MAASSLSSTSSRPSLSPRPHVLQDRRELRGILESVQPFDDGLVKVRIEGLERLIPEELTEDLNALLGKETSILRIGEIFSVVAVPV